MWKVTIKGLLAHKLRLALTALAIVLGVTFIAGTFVLTDTLHNTFDTLFGNIYQNVDFQVRGVAQFGSGGNATRNPVPESRAGDGAGACPGSQAAEGTVNGLRAVHRPRRQGRSPRAAPDARAVRSTPISRSRPCTSSRGARRRRRTTWSWTSGRRRSTGSRSGTGCGSCWRARRRTFTITGIAKFGTANNLAGRDAGGVRHADGAGAAGSAWASSTPSTWWPQPGADKAAGAARRSRRRCPRGVEVVTGQTVVNEQTSAISSALGLLQHRVVGVRVHRAVRGRVHDPEHVLDHRGPAHEGAGAAAHRRGEPATGLRSVLTEAGIVGLVSSLDRARSRRAGRARPGGAARAAFGVTLPSGPLVFEARTVIVCLVVGVGVTMVSAIGPARRAVRIAPVEAVAEQQVEHEISLRRRFTWGAVITLGGIAALAVGLTAPAIALVGLGAVLIFIGVARLAPAVGAPDVERPRAPARPAAGHVGPARAGELDAEPAPDGPDGVGADGGARAGLRHRRVRRVAVALGDAEHRQRASTPTSSSSNANNNGSGIVQHDGAEGRVRPCPGSRRRRPSTAASSRCAGTIQSLRRHLDAGTSPTR